jgi:IclR family transcriptional regulator, acetate operon repressor
VSENVVAAGATYQSAERALALLTSFDDSRPEQGVTELARSIGVHKSTASRLAAVLERAGLLARHGRRYRLGVETVRLGALALRSFDFAASMRPAMEKLSQRTGETINLAVPDGWGILNVAEVPATFILSCSSGWIGRRTRPHAVANGKVLLAHGAIPVSRQLDRYTEQTITDPRALEAELAAVRVQGWAAASGELEDGLVAVAAPVFDAAGTCVAALSVSGPAFRLRPESLAELGQLCASCAEPAHYYLSPGSQPAGSVPPGSRAERSVSVRPVPVRPVPGRSVPPVPAPPESRPAESVPARPVSPEPLSERPVPPGSVPPGSVPRQRSRGPW